jgi:hypothetical protein
MFARLTAGRDGPRLILMAEGAALLAASTFVYAQTGGNWLLFALLFLVPDLGMLGYLRNPRLGALGYNAVHTTVAPLALVAGGFALEGGLAVQVGLIWLGHIGFDRMLGVGLKYPDAFGHTHLSAGKARAGS